MKKMYATFCEMQPDRDGDRRTMMGVSTHDTRESALQTIDVWRRQNLPFDAWVVEFDDPRKEIDA